MSPRFGDQVLRAVWGSSRCDVWAVGDKGLTMHWDGFRWAAVSTPTTEALRAVSGRGPDEVYAVGAGGTILRWTGVEWTSVEGVPAVELYGVWVSPPGMPTSGFAVGSGKTLRLRDGGWVEVATGGVDMRVVAGIGKNGAYGLQWNVTSATRIHQWRDGAWVFLDQFSKGMRAMWVDDNGHAWVVGDEGAVVSLSTETPDRVYDAGMPVDLEGVWGDNDGTLYAAGDNGGMYTWHVDAGWRREVGQAQPLAAVFGFGKGEYLSVGARQQVVRRSPGEAPTVELPSANLVSVFALSPTDVWAIGRAEDPDISSTTPGTLLHWDGEKWSRPTVPNRNMLLGLWGFAPNDVWIAGEKATLWRWNGEQLVDVDKPDAGDRVLTNVTGGAADDVLVAGYTGRYHSVESNRGTAFIWHRSDGGWSTEMSQYTRALFDISGTSTSGVRTAGSSRRLDGGYVGAEVLERLDDGGWTRKHLDSQERVTGSWVSPERTVVVGNQLIWEWAPDAGIVQVPVSGSLQSVHGHPDAGTWAVGRSGSFAMRQANGTWVQSVVDAGAIFPDFSRVHFDSEGNGWAVGNQGTVMRLRDGGM